MKQKIRDSFAFISVAQTAVMTVPSAVFAFNFVTQFLQEPSIEKMFASIGAAVVFQASAITTLARHDGWLNQNLFSQQNNEKIRRISRFGLD